MILSDFFVFKQILILFSISQSVQVIEYLRIHDFFPITNPWLSNKKDRNNFKYLLWIRLILTLFLIPFAFINFHLLLSIILLLFVFHIATLWRFAGSFNGGSDDISTQTFLGLLLGVYLSPSYGIWFLSLQLIISYFAAGLIKIKNPQWRSGEALMYFLSAPQFALSPRIKITPLVAKFLSRGILFFELVSPLVLFSMPLAISYIGIALGFHYVNYLLFGLNRFFWGWIALYPALIYCSM